MMFNGITRERIQIQRLSSPMTRRLTSLFIGTKEDSTATKVSYSCILLVLVPKPPAHFSLQALISQTGISLFIHFIYCDSTTRYALFSFADRINNLRV